MANSTITQLTQATSITGAEYLEAVQTGSSVRVTAAQIAGLGLNNVPQLVASLPSAATSGAGARSFVSDASSTAFATIVAGGGANVVPVYSDAINWRIG